MSSSREFVESRANKVDESPKVIRVTILASEWGSSKGGLSTINRELAIQLAKCESGNHFLFTTMQPRGQEVSPEA